MLTEKNELLKDVNKEGSFSCTLAIESKMLSVFLWLPAIYHLGDHFK